MAKPAPKFDAKLKAEYRRLFDTATIKPSKANDVMATAQRIVNGRERYQAVSDACGGVPWYMIGIMHALECGPGPKGTDTLHFGKHLHCGDPLSRRTRNVPKGRPLTPGPWTWEESAIDAVKLKGLEKIGADNWTIERMCYTFEQFNGWGYRLYHSDVLSPYLWSYTNHSNKPGKYASDGNWDGNLVSKQSGTMALLLQVDLLCDDFDLKNEKKPLVTIATEEKSVVASIGAGAVGIYEWLTGGISDLFRGFGNAVSDIPSFISSAREPVEAVQTGVSWLGITPSSATVAVIAVLGSLALMRVIEKARG